MSKPPIVVFDLDGTLVNSAPDLLDSLNFCLEDSGLNAVKPSDIDHLVGQGGRVMIERALKGQNVEPENGKVLHLLEVFLKNYEANMPGKTRYFDGVDEILDQLAQDGFILAVCTNKYENMARRLLDTIEPKRRFATICGGDSFEWRKPDPRHILSTIEQAGGNSAQALMVGDSRADINAAKAAKIPVIGVDFGYSDVPVSALEPSRVVSSFRDITPALVRSLIV